MGRRAFFTGGLCEAEDDTEEEDGGKAAVCCGATGSEVEVLLGKDLGGALLLCEADPPPFCRTLGLTTFSSSIWVSAVP